MTVGTIFEDSHIPLHKWLLAIHLLTSSKKGMSAHQMMRNLDIKQYKSAWFMAHRIRYALTGELPEQINGIIEADETYIGGCRGRHQTEAIKQGCGLRIYLDRLLTGKPYSPWPNVAARFTLRTLKE